MRTEHDPKIKIYEEKRHFESHLNQVLSRRWTLFELFRVPRYERKIQKHRLLNYLYQMARLNVCVLRNFDFRQFVYTFVIFRRPSQLAASRSRITL